ncbi:MAG: TerB family tellurite resistance protein [Atopobiaceae bacterium]|nr:TerB family tellurite resistance protein [Atopobiaceae bacterium]
MNTKADIELKHFSQDREAFFFACDKLENSGQWDLGAFGPMAVYFEADLFAVALQVMSIDGVFETPEAEVLNAMFDTSYTPRELGELYESAAPVATAYAKEDEESALTLLAQIDPAVRDQYRDLLLKACDVIAVSDGEAEKSERMLIAALREALA